MGRASDLLKRLEGVNDQTPLKQLQGLLAEIRHRKSYLQRFRPNCEELQALMLARPRVVEFMVARTRAQVTEQAGELNNVLVAIEGLARAGQAHGQDLAATANAALDVVRPQKRQRRSGPGSEAGSEAGDEAGDESGGEQPAEEAPEEAPALPAQEQAAPPEEPPAQEPGGEQSAEVAPEEAPAPPEEPPAQEPVEPPAQEPVEPPAQEPLAPLAQEQAPEDLPEQLADTDPTSAENLASQKP